jgi:hypothetical protein
MAKSLYNEETGTAGTGVTPNASPIAPVDNYPERPGTYYEAKMAPDQSGGRGPMRFEEGLATDTDLPNEFSNGIMQGYITAGPNRNANVYEKWPEETMRERAHVGSAAWPEAGTYLAEFAHGTDTVYAERKYEEVDRGRPNPTGARYERHNPAQVND